MQDEPLLDYVLKRLRDREVPLEDICREARVSYFTVQKWLRRAPTRSPRVDTVQRLADYFRSRPNSKRAA